MKTEKVIMSQEWDRVVTETYGRPYCLQQQNGRQNCGLVYFEVPGESNDSDMNDFIPEFLNDVMGVKFAQWLDRNPIKLTPSGKNDPIWWERNFYPDFQTVANDLYTKGLLEAGEHIICID